MFQSRNRVSFDFCAIYRLLSSHQTLFQSRNRVSFDFCTADAHRHARPDPRFNLVIEFLLISAPLQHLHLQGN